MPRKRMRIAFFSPKPTTASPSPSPTLRSFSESVMDRTLELAAPVITKWNPDTAPFANARAVASLFPDNRGEAKHFIECVNNLQKAMHLLLNENPTSPKLSRAQNLIQTAMKTLQKEFYQLLSMNRAYLDPESVSSSSSRTSIHSTSDSYDDDDEEDEAAADSIAQVEDVSSLVMADLRLIAECMVSSGYAKECVEIYNIIRKSIIDEGIYGLGVEKFSSSSVHNMGWEALDIRIKKWLDAVNVSVKTLFNGERILSDHVFAVSESIRESCFTVISREGAMILFGFPESVVRNSKKSPEKVFRVLDMYTAIATHWPDIESIFSSESSSTVRSQAITSLVKMGQYVRAALAEFESTILKEHSKSTVAGGAIHHLTIDTMNYLSLLADYSKPLSDILADSPTPPASTTSPESCSSLSDSSESPAPAISLRFAWLILLLLAKLDGKAKLYRDASLSYLFLANNFRYVVTRVRTSNLKYLMGDDWLSKQEVKVRQLAANYQRLAWSHVIESLPEDPAVSLPPEEARECFKRFNASFEQAHEKQSVCVIPDSKLREDIKVNLSGRILPVYREFYDKHKAVIMESERNLGSIVRFSPEDVGHYLSDLFFGNVGSSSSSSSSHQSPSHSRSKNFCSTKFVGITTRYALSFFGSRTIKF